MDGWPQLDAVADSVIIVFGGMEIKYVALLLSLYLPLLNLVGH